jgi:drug/metabolite transporter (DMT)-like permease
MALPSATAADSRPIAAIAMVTAATAAFALADAVGKYLVALYPVPLVMALRYLINLALLVAIFAPAQGAALWQTRRTLWVLVRGLCLALASLTMGMALQVMPLAETLAITYLSPFGVLLLSAPLLGERVPALGWVAAGVGFAGVLLIVRPGAGLDPAGVALSLVNAGLAVAYAVLTRLLARTETMVAMLIWTAAVGSVVFALLLPGSGAETVPPLADLALLCLLGALATLGHVLFTAAFRRAAAATLSPFTYLHLVWAGLLGWLVFGEIPGPLSLLGMALIITAGIAITLVSPRPAP